MIEVHDDIVYITPPNHERREIGTLQCDSINGPEPRWYFEPHAGAVLDANTLKSLRRIVRVRDKASQ